MSSDGRGEPVPVRYEDPDKYYRRYERHSCAVGVMWGIFTVCFAIINVIVFAHPQWIGDTEDSPGTGYFGLYQFCEHFRLERRCVGKLSDFDTLLNPSLKAATVFIGLSALLIFLCIIFFFLFICVRVSYVYLICGWTQLLSCLCMLLGCIVFPSAWNHDSIKRLCGSTTTGMYDIGHCGMRWAYILAIIGIFDAMILATLAFVLASRQAREVYRYKYRNVNNAEFVYTEAAKPPMILQPVMAPRETTHDRRYAGSDYSNSSAKRAQNGRRAHEFTL